MNRYPPAPSHSMLQHEFLGTFHGGKRQEGPFQVILNWERDRAGRIAGYIVGDTTAFDRLQFPPLTEVSLNGTTVDGESVHCPRIHLERLRNQRPDRVGMVGTFWAPEVSLERSVVTGVVPSSTAEYLLSGPTGVWNVWRSFSGRRWKNTELALAEVPFKLTIDPENLVWQDSATQREISSTVYRLRIVEREAESSGEAFSDSADRLCDDILLLASFLTQHWIHRFERRLIEPNRTMVSRWSFSSDGDGPAPSFDEENNPAGAGATREFLHTALPKLRELRRARIDLSSPIASVITSVSGPGTIDEQFASAFFSLETLKSFFLAQTGGEFVLSPPEFKELDKSLRMAIEKTMPDESARHLRAMLYEKLRDVNRPAMGRILNRMLDHYGLGWRDLYPPGPELTRLPMTDVRDHLFHSGDKPSYGRTILETERIRGLAIRIILRMLGWQDVSNTPVGPYRYHVDRMWSLDRTEGPAFAFRHPSGRP